MTETRIDELLFGMAAGVAAICALSVLVLEVGGHAGWPPAALGATWFGFRWVQARRMRRHQEGRG